MSKLKQNYQVLAKVLLNSSRGHTNFAVCLFIIVLLLSHSGIEMISSTSERDLYSSTEQEEQLYNRDYEYSTMSNFKPDDYATTNGDVDKSLSNLNDRPRFWWTNGNRNNSKGPPKNNFPTTEAPKNAFDANSALNLISRLLRYVIINPGSTSRMQFFNANYRRNFSSLNDTAPRAIFGGPLCFGLCGVAQLYWANSSVQFFSGNKFPLPPIGAPGTVLPLPNPPSPGQG